MSLLPAVVIVTVIVTIAAAAAVVVTEVSSSIGSSRDANSHGNGSSGGGGSSNGGHGDSGSSGIGNGIIVAPAAAAIEEPVVGGMGSALRGLCQGRSSGRAISHPCPPRVTAPIPTPLLGDPGFPERLLLGWPLCPHHPALHPGPGSAPPRPGDKPPRGGCEGSPIAKRVELFTVQPALKGGCSVETVNIHC